MLGKSNAPRGILNKLKTSNGGNLLKTEVKFWLNHATDLSPEKVGAKIPCP